MKKVLIMIMSAFMLSATAYAGSVKDFIKERKELMKQSKSELTKRATKQARNEAKALKKEGWKIAPGALPLEKQLDRAYQMQYEFNDDMTSKYLVGSAMSISENYDGAKMQAVELAKQEMAGLMQTEITAIIENTVANSQLAQEDAATIVESVSASKNVIAQSFGRATTVVECYREKSNKNKEVRIWLSAPSAQAKEIVKNAVKKDLQEKGNKLHEQLDKILGF